MTKALHIVVNRTLEHGHRVAKVKKQGDEVTVVFRQREQKADFLPRFLTLFAVTKMRVSYPANIWQQ